MEQSPVRVVVLGAGFGGLTFCQTLRSPNVTITLVDRQNHHLFQPLLYQVATAGLSAPEIAQPIRSIFSKDQRVTVLMDEVQDFNLSAKQVVLGKSTVSYDYLVIGLGGMTSYFGHPEWEQFAPGLKSLHDAMRIRRGILLAYERAEAEPDGSVRQQLMTIAVIGGGPTGLELAGTFAELARTVLNRDFRRIDPSHSRIILIEGGPRVLAHLPPELSASAQKQLEKLGATVRVNARVNSICKGCVELAGGEVIHAENIIWAAGVSATPITKKLGADLDRTGRIKVHPDLSLPNRPEVFAIGDTAAVTNPDGTPVPGLSPAAMQMGRHVAHIIDAEIREHRDQNPTAAATARPAFKYTDKGTMATIGRSAAVAKIGKLEFSGYPAWIAWLVVHLVFLVGFRNKIAVLLQWAYSYFTYKRGARIVSNDASDL